MGKRTGFRFVFSAALLFAIAVICVILFYTCSLEYAASIPTEIPQEQIPSQIEQVQIPEQAPEVTTDEPAAVIGDDVVPAQSVELPEEPEVVVEDIPYSTVEETPASPAVPAAPGITGVPDAPDLDWFVLTEIASSTPAWDGSSLGADIDWSEFVFSDEEVALPDGTYYANLFVNDTAYGAVQFEQVDSVQHFRRSDLQTELTGTLSEDYSYIFFQDESVYYTLEYLEGVAEGVSYDSANLVLKLYFNSSQVPLQTLSMGSSSYSLIRQNYDVVGNVVLEPAKFSLQSNISAYLSAQYTKDLIVSGLNASVSFSNTFSFWNMTFGLPVSISYTRAGGLYPSIGNWSGYIDFPNNSLRLSFGNVGNSGFSNGSPFGFTLEKSYSFGTGSAMNNQYAQVVTLVEDSTITIKVNGNVVYTKTLSLGEYRLTDFAFVQGANDIEVLIHPISMGSDTSKDTVQKFNQNYDTSLLAMGESTWRLGASIPKTTRSAGSGSDSEFGFVVPALPHYSGVLGFSKMENSYNLGALSVFWEQSVGISHVYTQTHSFSFIFERNSATSEKPGEYSATFGTTISGTLATKIGTTRATINGLLDSSSSSRSSLSINLSQSFSNAHLKALSLSGSYTITPDVQTVSLNTGYSWSLKASRISLSLSSSYRFKTLSSSPNISDPLTINGSLSLSSTFGKNISFSLSSSINQDLMFYATASMSFAIGGSSNVNSSVSTSNGVSYIGNLGLSYRPTKTSRNSYQLNMSNINMMDLRSHVLSAAWSRSGDIVGMSLRTQASNNYTRFSTTLSLNTAIAFADGEFAMTNSLYGPFLIISPEGNLKKSSISVASATDSNSSTSKKTFGNVLHTRLGMYKGNNIAVYASNGSLFSSSGSFLFKITPVARQGFLARISLESSIAVSGVIKRNSDTVYDSYSSPIYRVVVNENGTDVDLIEIDSSSYFFTDIDGRFILSDLKPGVYMFDLESNGQWYAAFFEVPSIDKVGYVALYKDYVAGDRLNGENVMERYNVKSFDESYAGSVFIELDRFISETEYWDMLFSIQQDEYDFFSDDMWFMDDEEETNPTVYQRVTNSAL